MLSVLTGRDPEELTGRGAGLSGEALRRKVEVIRRGIERNRPDPADPVDVVMKVGGFDIAALCGLYLGAAAERLPVVSDGFISTTAALLARRLCPAAGDFIIPSHRSAEPGFACLAEAAALRPMLDMGMRLGEGSGCPLAFFLCDCACAVIRDMATLEEAAVGEQYGVPFLPSDFKKREGYKRSIELSKEYGLYRQEYCGCLYSKPKAN